MQEKLLSKKERHNVRFAQKDPTAKMPRQLRLALLESTGTGRGRRHPVLALTARQEPLLWKKERRNARFAQKDRTVQLPFRPCLALLESTGTGRGR